jgi:hypothetical protein
MKAIDEINVFEVIQQNVAKRNEFVITPLNILKLEGFPISDQNFVLNNKVGVQKIKSLLVSLEKEGWLTKRKSKQDFKGIKETAFNFVEK